LVDHFIMFVDQSPMQIVGHIDIRYFIGFLPDDDGKMVLVGHIDQVLRDFFKIVTQLDAQCRNVFVDELFQKRQAHIFPSPNDARRQHEFMAVQQITLPDLRHFNGMNPLDDPAESLMAGNDFCLSEKGAL